MNYYDATTGEAITEDDLRDAYDEALDETCDEVRIGAHSWSPSYALKNLDPIAYRVGFIEWTDEDYVESGYWVETTNEVGVSLESEWYTDKDDAVAAYGVAREIASDVDGMSADEIAARGAWTVRLVDTDGDTIAEDTVTV